MKLEELKESVPAPTIDTVAGGRLATKKSLTRRIPEFFSSMDPEPAIIQPLRPGMQSFWESYSIK